MSEPSQPDTLLDPDEVAAMFRVHAHTVAKWAREGKLPATKTPGGRWKIYEAGVRAVLNGGQS